MNFGLLDQRQTPKAPGSWMPTSCTLFFCLFVSWKDIFKSFFFMPHQKETNNNNKTPFHKKQTNHFLAPVPELCHTWVEHHSQLLKSHTDTEASHHQWKRCHPSPQLFSQEKVVRHCIWELWQPKAASCFSSKSISPEHNSNYNLLLRQHWKATKKIRQANLACSFTPPPQQSNLEISSKQHELVNALNTLTFYKKLCINMLLPTPLFFFLLFIFYYFIFLNVQYFSPNPCAPHLHCSLPSFILCTCCSVWPGYFPCSPS